MSDEKHTERAIHRRKHIPAINPSDATQSDAPHKDGTPREEGIPKPGMKYIAKIL